MDEMENIKRDFIAEVDSLVALRDAHKEEVATLRAEVERLRGERDDLLEACEAFSDWYIIHGGHAEGGAAMFKLARDAIDKVRGTE
jgi:hypothetical protein